MITIDFRKRTSRVAIATLAAFAACFALAATASADLGRVVAVGDSLAAGTNLGPATGTYPKCGQSTGSYMELAMARVKKSAWVDMVCNGGHSGVIDGGTWYGINGSAANGDPLIPAQMDSLNGSEDVVIVGSGANEAFFGQITKICLGHDGSPTTTYTLSENACSIAFPAGLRPYTLNSEQLMGPLIDKIHVRSPNAKVILVGVPRITPADGVGCMPDPVLTLGDAPVWSVWEDTLRTSMIKVANEHNATYVDNSALSGPEHSMCAPVNMRWMHPWTVAGGSWPGTPLHNTPWGADAMADNLVNAIKSTGRDTGTPNAPTLSRTLPSATPTQMTSQVLTYSGAAGHTFKCRLDNAAYAACSGGSVTVSSLSAGPHSYSVIQTNASGYRSPAAILTWTVDVTAPTAPTVTRTNPVSTPTNSTTQTITYAGAESGGTFQCKLDSAAYAPCPSSPATLSGLTSTSHTYYVTQTDAAGNVSPAASVTWTVNTVAPPAPNVTRTSPAATPTNSTTQVITYSGNQAGGTFQCSLDAAPPTGCPSSPITLTGLGSTSHSFSVTHTDVLGNVGSATTVVWTVDLVPPAAPIVTRTSPTATPTNSATQTITFAGAEAGGTLQCKLDSAAYGACPASPVTLNGLGGGSHAFSVRQTDDAGNVGAVAAVSWTVDIIPPPTPIVSGPSGVSALDSASITYSDSEAGVTFQCKLDSAAYAPCPASPVGLSGLSEGVHTYYVTATDSAGNTSGAGSASWTFDPSGFTVSISASPSNPATVATASFSFVASVVPGTTYECKLDAAAFSSCSSPKTYNSLPDGSHTFTVHGINGSLTTPDASRTWVVDTTAPGAPTLTRTSPTATPTNMTSQTFSLSAAESGGVLSCKLDNGAVSTCPSSPVTITGLGDGVHTFAVTQTDAAGNTGSAATVTWSVDIAPPNTPTVARTSPTANPTNSTSQTLTYSGAEAGGTFQCKLDTAAFGPCPASPLTFTVLGEGSHTLQVTQTDAAGNVSSAASATWVVDTVAPSAPSVLRTNPTASLANSTTQQVSLAGTESGTSLRCKLDAGAYLACPSSPATFSGLTQGAHTLLVTQTDAAGNVSSAASVTWTIDSIAPGAPAIGFNRPAFSPVNSATIGFAPAETGGTFECSMDSAAWMPCPGNPFDLIAIPEGPHNYMIRQIDAAGNEGTVAQVAWVVDTIAPLAPTVTRTSPTASPTNSTSQTLTFSGAENGGKLECKLDNAAYAICPSSPVSLSNLSFATHTYSVRQTDTATNVSDVATVTWVVEPDTTPPLAPTVTRTSPTASPTNSTSQTVSYSGAEPGGTFKCKLDASAYSTCPASPYTTNGLAHGTHTISITQTDSSGNVSPAGTVTWAVDIVGPNAPTVTRTSPLGNPTPLSTQTIAYSGAEAGGTFECKLDTAPFSNCPSSPVSISGLADGSHSYSVTQTDDLGNVGSAATVTWIVDSSAPSTPIVTRTAPTANPTNSTSQTITYSGETSGTFECKLDDAAYASCPSSPVTLTNLSSGPHTYSVKQTDLSGNVGPPATVTWSIDTTPPSAPTVTRSSPTGTPTNSSSQTITYSDLEPGAAAQCKLDGAAYSACSSSPFTLSGLAGGTHTVSITQTDISGNVSPAGTVTWTVDLIAPTAPAVTRTAPTANPTASTSQTIAYSGEAGATFQCKRDLEAYAPCAGSPVTLAGLTDGTHTYSVTQTDSAGNLGSAATVTWVVDISAPNAPTVTRTSPTANPTNSTSQTYTYSGEPGGSFQCKLDAAAYGSCASTPATLTGLSEGTHNLSVTQTDALGNVGQPTTVTWTVDVTAPNAPTVTRTNPAANPTNSTSQSISYSGLEGGATAQCKLDNAAYAPCAASPFTLSGLSSGTHTYSITQTDAAGNTSIAGAASWVVDLSPPPAPNVSGPSGTTALRSATISYSDAEAGVTFRCKLDSGAYAACDPSPIGLTGLPDGVHTYYVTATDAAGNASAAGTATWTVDPTIVGISITSAPGSLSKLPAASFTFASTGPNGTTFECKLDAGTFESCTSPKSYSGLADGSHTFAVRAVNGGQTLAETSRSWTIDSTPPGAPALTRASPTDSPTSATQQTLTIVGSEPGGVLSCAVNGSPYQTCPSSPVILTELTDGVYELSVTQTDSAGNTGSPASVTWVVDTIAPTAPTVTRSSPSASPTSSTSQTISYGGEAGSTFVCKFDSGLYAPCVSPTTLSGLSLGSHTFSVRQIDAAGNSSPASAVAWTVENPAPPGSTTPINPPNTQIVTELSAKLSPVAPKSIIPARSGSPFSLKSRGSVASFRVTLSAEATVSLRLERVVSGASRASTNWTKFKLKPGRTTIYLSGRANNRALPAGSYKVHLTVGGAKQNELSRSFRIKR